MAFMSLTTAQLLHILSFRSGRHSVFSADRPPTNPLVLGALLGGIGLQVVTLAVPSLRRLLRNTPLTAIDAAARLLGAGLPYLVNEARKELARTEMALPLSQEKRHEF